MKNRDLNRFLVKAKADGKISKLTGKEANAALQGELGEENKEVAINFMKLF